MPTIRLHQGGKDLHRGGLAGAVGTQHAEHRTLRNAKVKAVEGLHLLIVLHQSSRDHGIGHVKHTPTNPRPRATRFPPREDRSSTPHGISRPPVPVPGRPPGRAGDIHTADPSMPASSHT